MSFKETATIIEILQKWGLHSLSDDDFERLINLIYYKMKDAEHDALLLLGIIFAIRDFIQAVGE
jgi:hypothetical protein